MVVASSCCSLQVMLTRKKYVNVRFGECLPCSFVVSSVLSGSLLMRKLCGLSVDTGCTRMLVMPCVVFLPSAVRSLWSQLSAADKIICPPLLIGTSSGGM